VISPTLEELQDFTLNTYVKLLKYLKQIYTIVPFCDIPSNDIPYLILRHDIDVSLPAALKMAQIEKNLNIKSTYFVLFSSKFYNVLEGDNVNILKQILKLGHEIGLHYCPAQYKLYNQNPMKTLKIEIQLLEQLLNKKIYSISRHGPWVRDPFARIKKYINANHPSLRENLFIHESDRAWTPLQNLVTLLNNPPKRVQFLTHPENWQEDKIDRSALLERHCENLKKKYSLLKQEYLNYYQTEPTVSNYYKTIRKVSISQSHIPDRKGKKNQNRVQQALNYYNTLFRYYLVNTTFGWKLKQIKTQLKQS
jgi:hypothetical protein